MLSSRSALGSDLLARRARYLTLVCAALVASSCNPTRTDPTYWDRTALARDEDEEPSSSVDPTSDVDAAAPGGDVAPSPSAACARIEATTISYRGEFAPNNIGAIWITTSSGAFVRTLEVWGSKRLEHAVAWLASSNGDDVDAITG